MENFDFKSRSLFSVGPHLIGLLFIAAGLIALASPLFFREEGTLQKPLLVGAGAILLGLTIASTYTGTRIDFQDNKIKQYTSVLGYSVGQWSELPPIVMVKVVAQTYRTSNMSNGVSPTFSGETTVYKVLLYSKDLVPYLSFIYISKALAIRNGSILAENLQAVLEQKIRE